MTLATRQRAGRLLLSLAIACALAVPLVAQKKQTAAKPQKSRVVLPSLQEQTTEGARRTPGSQDQDVFASRSRAEREQAADSTPRIPREHRLRRANSFDGDLRGLPQTRPTRFERPEREGPDPNPVVVEIDPLSAAGAAAAAAAAAPASALRLRRRRPTSRASASAPTATAIRLTPTATSVPRTTSSRSIPRSASSTR
jgi:hypothetical protein